MAELRAKLASLDGENTLVFGPGMSDWIEARHVPALASRLVAPPTVPTARRSDEIDYEVFGSEMQYVEVTLDPGEMVLAEAGAMMYMTDGIQMDTVFGDPSAPRGGFWSKVAAAGKRVMTGESMFMTTFTNGAPSGREVVAFASPFPGKVVPMHLDELGGELICQRDSFLCAARGTQIGIAFRKRIGVGLFGGEGFIMQRLTGDGIALVPAGA
ncbi:MAG TPA: AIM24 family protein, partial [Pirellulales bacterium]